MTRDTINLPYLVGYNLRSGVNLIGILFCLSVISGVVFRSITSVDSGDIDKNMGYTPYRPSFRGVRIDRHS
jgi:hypothetical protein